MKISLIADDGEKNITIWRQAKDLTDIFHIDALISELLTMIA